MTDPTVAAEVKASVDVSPVRSQVFLVAVLIVAAIAVYFSASLIRDGKTEGWVFLIFAALAIGGAGWAWLKSQSDVDLQDAHPTQLSLPDGTTLTTDIRILRSPEGIQAMARLWQEMLCRRPLPPPDGLVDSSAQVIPDSKGAALALANQINSATQATTNALIDALGLADADPNVTQQIAVASEDGPDGTSAPNLNVPMDG